VSGCEHEWLELEGPALGKGCLKCGAVTVRAPLPLEYVTLDLVIGDVPQEPPPPVGKKCRGCERPVGEPHVPGCGRAYGELVDDRSCEDALAPPDGPRALQLLRDFAALDIRDGAVARNERFREDPGKFFEEAMAGLQVIVRAHLSALDSAPPELSGLVIQILVDTKAREHEEKAVDATSSDSARRDHASQAYALRQFALFLRESRGAGTTGGT
jgi:hypothetical protein